MNDRETRLLRALEIVARAEPLLEPTWDPRTREGYVYAGGTPLEAHSLAADLSELASADLVEPVFVERVSYCVNCESHAVNVFEACLTCSSSNLAKVKTLLHFRCGYVGPLEAFGQEAQGLRCPKCRKLLQTPGTDHDSPGEFFRCRRCNAEFQLPETGARCLGCGSRYVGVEMQRIRTGDVNAYRLTQLGKAALGERRLPAASPAAPAAAVPGAPIPRHALLDAIEGERRRRRDRGERFALLLLIVPDGDDAEAATSRAVRAALESSAELGRLDPAHLVALLPASSSARARGALRAVLQLERERKPRVAGGLVVELPEGGDAAEELDRAARTLSGASGRV